MPFITKDGLNKRLTDLERRVCCHKTLFYDNLAAFPVEGKVETLYVDESTGAVYIWTGTEYITADFQPIHTNVTEAVPYTGVELPTEDGVIVGDTVSAKFNNNIVGDYTWDGAVWVLNFTTKAVIPQVYKALISQTGTDAPTAVIMENTLSGTPVWTYVDVGEYRLTLAGAFTVGKTAVSTQATFGVDYGIPIVTALFLNYIDIGTYSLFASDYENGIFEKSFLSIEIYP